MLIHIPNKALTQPMRGGIRALADYARSAESVKIVVVSGAGKRDVFDAEWVKHMAIGYEPEIERKLQDGKNNPASK